MGEFDLIARFFKRPVTLAALGVGDDCALLNPAPGTQLAISSDMLVQGRHFFADVDPRTLGHKSLAVNLSDLAACGATPLAGRLCRWPVCVGRCSRLRTDRWRHHRRAAEHLHHCVW